MRLADGDTISASRAVLACVTPTQLYGRLLGEADAPARVREQALRFRYGRGEMQIHIAMNELPRWNGDERLARTPLVHLTPGLDGVSRAVNEADRGLLPAEATVVLGQPMTVDPSRAPDGSWVIWVQLQELPPVPKGDAAGELEQLIQAGDGTWTEALREAYADRIVERIGRHIENLSSATVARVVLSPTDMEAANPNWVGRRHLRRDRAPSTRTCSSARRLRRRATRRRSSSSGTSAQARTPAPASVPDPAIWSRSS